MDYADQSERYARPFKLEQTTVDGLTTTMQTTVSQKVGQAMRTIADGLAWTTLYGAQASRVAKLELTPALLLFKKVLILLY